MPTFCSTAASVTRSETKCVGRAPSGFTRLRSLRGKEEAVDVEDEERDAIVDVAKLENSLREDLNKKAPRVMGVLEPIKVIITNYPDNEIEYLDAKNNPEDESAGKRKLAFSKEIFIDKNDFMEDPPKKFFRLSPGKEVRLKFAYYIVCENVIKNDSGEITEIHCSYDPNTKGGMSEDGRKVRGTLHWVSAQEFIEAEVRLYDRLFMSDNPENNGDFIDDLNPESLSVIKKYKFWKFESGIKINL